MTRNKSLPLLISVTSLILVFAAQAHAQSINLEPDKPSVAAGETLTIKVSVDTGPGNGSNSYIAALDYPKDKLTFDSINTENSPFNMALEAKGGDGKVSIIRGSTKALEGKHFAAAVHFKAKSQTGAGEVTVSNDSAIIRSSDNTNILPGSTVQKDNGSGTPAMENETMVNKNQSGSFMGIINWIKNLFSSFFK